MAERLSIRAYARRRGCSDSAVRKAIAAGRITKERDGKILPEKADAEWVASADRLPPQSRQAKRRPGTAADIMQARLEKLEIEVEHTRVKVDRLRGNLVDKSVIGKRVFALFRQERDAWQAWPARVSNLMAHELGVPQATLHTLLEAQVRAHLAELAEQATHEL
ncbi:elements of external origin [Candidatus Latescibacterota bacterium]